MVGTVIKSLVSQGKRVIIPDFGAFLIKDSTLSSILTKENITFSPFLKYNDGFLEGELAHAHGLPKDDARLQVAAFVEAVKTALNVDKKAYEIPGLGFFYKDKQGNAAFSITSPSEEAPVKAAASMPVAEVAPSAPVEPELVGKPVEEAASAIPNIIFSPSQAEAPAADTGKEVEPVLEQIEQKPAAAEVKAEKKVESRPSKPIKEEKKQEQVTRASETSTPTAPRRKPKALLVSFILLAGALFVLNFFWSDIFGSQSDASKPKIVLDPIDSEQKAAETEKLEAKEVAQDAIDDQVVSTVEKTVNKPTSTDQEKPVKDAEPAKKVEAPKSADSKKVAAADPKKGAKESSSTAGKTYVVVLGSFQTSEGADKHVENLAKKKIKGHVLHRSTVYSVVTATYKTYEEAQAEQERAKSLGVDGWISSK
ncbi:SPOR domain-containing protein [uncultured Acetobacteroides sp.]|uniref:SPOR domain-containing protein n=1 Tax=uncultured Acetobacteroides sp. TaxID=1760811 RepID=UPI0029F5001D|nr:SPOR domain-containing protein [uncultured Acetobacteroides sp.]